jgi:hypothetical protein
MKTPAARARPSAAPPGSFARAPGGRVRGVRGGAGRMRECGGGRAGRTLKTTTISRAYSSHAVESVSPP